MTYRSSAQTFEATSTFPEMTHNLKVVSSNLAPATILICATSPVPEMVPGWLTLWRKRSDAYARFRQNIW